MKRLISMALALVIMATFVSCGSASSSGSQTPSAPAQSQSGSADASGTSAGSLGIPVPETPYMIQFAGATSGGSYFLICNAIAELLNAKYSEYFNASVQSTAGTAAILRALQEEEVEFGIAQAGLAKDAMHGQNNFDEAWENFSSISYVFPTVMHLAAVNDDKIQTFADFAGTNFAVGAAGSATELNSRSLCDAYGLTYDSFKSVEYTSEAQSVELLKNKQLTGANLIAAQGSASPTDLMSSAGFKFLNFSENDLKMVLEKADSFYPYTIPANTYMNQNYDVSTYAVANFLYANNSVPDEVVYAVTKAIFENLDYLKGVYSLLDGVTLDTAFDGMTVPLHAGAKKYFDDAGVK